MHPFITPFLCLLTAHLLGDFPLQTDSMVKAKEGGPGWGLVRHAAIHAVLALALLGIFSPWRLPVAILGIMFLSHWQIDRWFKPLLIPARVRDDPKEWPRKLIVFSADQFLHVLVLIALTWWTRVVAPASAMPWGMLVSTSSFLNRILVQICGFIVSVWFGGVVIGYRVEPLLDEMYPRTPEGLYKVPPRGFKGAGKLIGSLERSLVYAFVILGQYSAIGFLVTAKSILRFGEIKSAAEKDSDNRKEPEYVLIGTLMSVAWAIAAGMLTLAVVQYLPASPAMTSVAVAAPSSPITPATPLTQSPVASASQIAGPVPAAPRIGAPTLPPTTLPTTAPTTLPATRP